MPAPRQANAAWKGSLKEGTGNMKFGNGAFDGAFSFASRFEEGTGTNPEELIGAAHAGCYSMQLSGELSRAGGDPKRIETEAKVLLRKDEIGFKISKIILTSQAEVAGLDEKQFQEAAAAAKKNCPVSRALTGVEVELHASWTDSARDAGNPTLDAGDSTQGARH